MKRKTVALESINYTFVPNHQETMEALARARLSAREFKIVILILNQTDGYLRQEDTIRPDFFQERTGIPKNHLSHALARLRAWNVISQQKHAFKVAPPQQWAPETFADSPKTASHSPKTAKTLAENGENQIHTKDNTKDNLLKTTLTGKKNSPKTAKTPDPRVTGVMEAAEKERGWKSPSYAAEAGAVKWMLRDYTPEDILGCRRWLSQNPFWDSTSLLMMSVKKQIGIWVQKDRPTTWQPPLSLYTPKTSRIEKLPSPEAFKEGSTW